MGMTSKTSINLALVAAGAIASVPTMAAPVTISESFTLNALLQNGGASQLNFDIGGFLTAQGLSAGRVVSGEMVVHGFSEASYGEAAAGAYSGYQQTGSSSHYATRTQYAYVPGYTQGYSYSCRSTWGYTTCYGSYWVPGYSYGYQVGYTIGDTLETRYRDIMHIDSVADQMKVTAGNSSATDTADTHSNSVGAYGNANYEGQICRYYDGAGNCSYAYEYNRERDTYDAVFGALDTSLSLDLIALQDLRNDGLLGVGFSALAGQFNLQSINFTLQVEPGSDVPEPASLLLAGAALAGAAAATRRRRKA